MFESDTAIRWIFLAADLRFEIEAVVSALRFALKLQPRSQIQLPLLFPVRTVRVTQLQS
eukprot:gene18907-897_t